MPGTGLKDRAGWAASSHRHIFHSTTTHGGWLYGCGGPMIPSCCPAPRMGPQWPSISSHILGSLKRATRSNHHQTSILYGNEVSSRSNKQQRWGNSRVTKASVDQCLVFHQLLSQQDTTNRTFSCLHLIKTDQKNGDNQREEYPMTLTLKSRVNKRRNPGSRQVYTHGFKPKKVCKVGFGPRCLTRLQLTTRRRKVA